MRSVKKHLIIAGMLLAFAVVLITVPAVLTAAEKEEVPSWDWKGKEPVWWKFGKDYYPTKPVRGGTFRGASGVYIGLMNPNHWPVNDWVTIGYFHEKLIYTDANYKPTIPWMAASWEFINPTTVIMKLKKGIEFTDDSPFNAETVKYQMDWIKDKSNGAWSRAWIAELDSTDVVDEYTVRFNLRNPWAGFAGNMSNVPGYVMSAKALKADRALIMSEKLIKKLKKAQAKAVKAEKKASAGGATEKVKTKAKKARDKANKIAAELAPLKELAKGAKKYDQNPVGSGPYMVDEAKPGNYLKLKRNPNWWFGQSIGRPDMPYYDDWIITVIPDQSIRLANFRAGKLHSLGIGGEQFEMVKNDKNIQIARSPGNAWYGLSFNTVAGPCKDIRVRKAVTHAIDKKAIIYGILFGLGFEASGPYPGVHWAHNPNLKPTKYDPELSKKLLAEAGYKKGLTIEGFISSGTVSWTEAIQAMLAKVGIKWKVDYLDGPAGDDRRNNLEFELQGGGYTWIYDPDLMATAMFHSEGNFNRGRYVNPKLDELILKGRSETDPEKRLKIYWEIEKIVVDDYSDVFVYWPEWITVRHKVIGGYNFDLHMSGQEAAWWSHPTWFKDGKGKVTKK